MNNTYEEEAHAVYVHELEERERALTFELANNHEFIRRLRERTKFLHAAGWEQLKVVIDLIYNGYTRRLKSRFPHLTEVDMQLCILLKLRFSAAQIATVMAVSLTSVPVQKNRLKRRLLLADGHLFDAPGTTLDTFLAEF